MGYVDTLAALIAEKEADVARLEAELSAAEAYIKVLQQRLRSARERLDDAPASSDPILAIRRLILEAGQPLFIDDILHGLGRPVTRESREQLRRLLLPWVRRHELFTRPRPSMFGLIELDDELE